MKLEYGGLRFGHHLLPTSLINLRLSSDFGAGYIYEKRYHEDRSDNKVYKHAIRIVEPEIIGMVNVTKNIRIGAGYSTRLVPSIGTKNFEARGFQNSGWTFVFEVFELDAQEPRILAH